jgi:CubicO group peptidase (beta-lactamase class C family)
MFRHAALAAVVVSSLAAATPSSDLTAPLAAVERAAQATFAQRPLGSITLAVVAGKDVVLIRSYGNADIETKNPATPDTVYRIGSLTKMFTGLMLEQLVEAGKVRYTDHAASYLPEIESIPAHSPDAPPVTLLQLATHTAGLAKEPDNMDLFATGGPPSSWEKPLLAALLHTRYEFDPGTHYQYSNIGYAILGAALARASGESYMDYIPRHILQPLGMTHCALERTPAIALHLATGYEPAANGLDAATPRKEHEGRGYKMPSGAMYSTAGDLARFASFLLGQGPDTVLGPAALERWMTPPAPPFAAYGHGVMAIHRPDYIALGHSGAVAGYAAALYLNRSRGIGVIVLTNAPLNATSPTILALRCLDLLSSRPA